ncbi:MAG: pilus assembly protein [Proteobacteria bacterium]|nr:pilus assembly protein [Pseudomonadota bacterium]
MMAKGMTHHRRARTSPNAPATVAIGAGLRRLCARVAACRLGSVAIEFAVLLPVFLALIYGLFEFARVAWTQTTLEYAVEEAARFAMVNPSASETEITDVANDSATGLDAAEIHQRELRDGGRGRVRDGGRDIQLRSHREDRGGRDLRHHQHGPDADRPSNRLTLARWAAGRIFAHLYATNSLRGNAASVSEPVSVTRTYSLISIPQSS